MNASRTKRPIRIRSVKLSPDPRYYSVIWLQAMKPFLDSLNLDRLPTF